MTPPVEPACRVAITCLLPAIVCAALPAVEPVDPSPITTPVLQVDYPGPTADKPQSKLWYREGSWWAVLPTSRGPALWQRTAKGWVEHPEVARALSGVPGRADVWPGTDSVTAVAVAEPSKANRSATLFRLTREGLPADIRWSAHRLAELHPPAADELIETVTLLQDTAQTWWVAAVAGTQVCVWSAPADAVVWSPPSVLAEGLTPDDICLVTPLSDNQIAVIWSDQVREGFFMGTRRDGDAPGDWQEASVIRQSAGIADDHLNTVLIPDGTLWLATKNEIDTDGQPQFTLHAWRDGRGWQSWPYGVRQAHRRPSRPIVVASADGSAVFTGYGVHDPALLPPQNAHVVFSRVDPERSEPVGTPRTVIAPDPSLNSTIQNVTGPRAPFPVDAPWIILASDQEGRVYEADLRRAFPEVIAGSGG